MKKLYRNILIIIIAIFAFLVIGIYSGILSAGSYPYSENYKFHLNKDSLISAIEKFKENNPGYRVPKEVGIIDTLDENKIFYNFWIYYPKHDKIVFFIVEGDYQDDENSTLRLISVNKGLILGHWNTINDDISRDENIGEKKQFQTQILDKLKLDYKDDGNNMFVFWK